jgi:membrane-bound lytic murein transglycosylase MltF
MARKISGGLGRTGFVLACCAVFASCGGDRVPGAAPSAEEQAAESGPEDSALAAQLDDAAVQDEAELATLSADDRLPMSFGRIWQPWYGDFDAMEERRIVRAVVPYGGYQFFYEEGRPRGVTWELLQRFEGFINDRLGSGHVKVYLVVIPVDRDELIPALLSGHADIVAGDLTVTDERSEKVDFSRPLLEDIDEVVVAGPSAAPIASLDDLAGREIVVRASSSYYEHLEQLAANFEARGLEPPEMIAADEILEAEDLLEMVNSGIIELTIMDRYKAEFWDSIFPDIDVRADLIVNEGGTIAWALRKDSPKLALLIDDFLRSHGRGTMIGNDTFNRYLADPSRVRCSTTRRALKDLNDLVDVFQKYGEDYDWDWLMLAAQAYQESGLDQDRRSAAGAVGIMQIRPATAADPNVAVDNIETVDGNVHAGAKYMRFLADRYFADGDMDELSRWIFSLAAYNAGPARVAVLRREAAESGYDPNTWFDNVEIVAARRIGRETVTYVSNVFKYYVGYQLTVARGAIRDERYEDELPECRAATWPLNNPGIQQYELAVGESGGPLG